MEIVMGPDIEDGAIILLPKSQAAPRDAPGFLGGRYFRPATYRCHFRPAGAW
jgi:hypothetical protein